MGVVLGEVEEGIRGINGDWENKIKEKKYRENVN